jgi:hypothetical protein
VKVRRKKKKVENRVSTSEASQLALLPDEEKAREAAAKFIGELPKKKRPAKPKKKIEEYVEEAKLCASSGDWSGAGGRVFVGLFAFFNTLLYGSIPLELYEARELSMGAKAANRALHEFFNDDKSALVEFMKWSWESEKRKDAWAMRNGKTRQRMLLRWQFSPQKVQDYRVEKSRANNGR